jgi:hypothetical protein
MTEFPGNSKAPRERSEKKVEQVVTGEVQSRKKPIGKRLKELFIGGDSKSVIQYVISEVLIPQAKDMFTEGVSSGVERLIYGESRPPGRRFGSRPTGPSTYTNYNRFASRGNQPIGRSLREDRAPNASVQTHGIDDILFATRVEAETVLDRMYDLLREYENASVSDLYSLIGWSSSFTDQKWGWTELHGSGVQRVRDGYLLNLPKPTSLD